MGCSYKLLLYLIYLIFNVIDFQTLQKFMKIYIKKNIVSNVYHDTDYLCNAYYDDNYNVDNSGDNYACNNYD